MHPDDVLDNRQSEPGTTEPPAARLVNPVKTFKQPVQMAFFDTRPFIGNGSLANVPALAAYEAPRAGGDERVSLDEAVR